MPATDREHGGKLWLSLSGKQDKIEYEYHRADGAYSAEATLKKVKLM
ncbi:MAG: hypothetical protein DDT27_00998 [Dehalococcoidia bacterium]|nr:hypothetical protein [Chloroflexota bacterium]MBT9160353.1 hypothetical protein [Chloroflexota bacterium]MBT9162440.1 hypothetical protein [Chloroflexota bacterium]